MNRHTQENTARVVALAIAFFGGLALLAVASGVFDRLGPEATLQLAAFAVAFAALTYHLDPGVRAFVRRLVTPREGARKPGRTAPV